VPGIVSTGTTRKGVDAVTRRGSCLARDPREKNCFLASVGWMERMVHLKYWKCTLRVKFGKALEAFETGTDILAVFKVGCGPF
jgi:hypothetical protein